MTKMPREIWFVSDTHFGHERIIEYCRPQFLNVHEMNVHMIQQWNSVVGDQDLVYHLGDFAWKTSVAKEIRPLLNGTIRLIVGNHDDIPSLAATGMFQRMSLWRHFEDIGVTATHVPLRLDQLRHGPCNLHGHVHGKTDSLDGWQRDVSVESVGYTPVNRDVVAEWAKNWVESRVAP